MRGREGEGEGREGGGGREREGGRGGREEGMAGGREGGSEGGMTVIHILIVTQQIHCPFHHNVTYYVITCKSAFDWVYAAQQWYVLRPT